MEEKNSSNLKKMFLVQRTVKHRSTYLYLSMYMHKLTEHKSVHTYLYFSTLFRDKTWFDKKNSKNRIWPLTLALFLCQSSSLRYIMFFWQKYNLFEVSVTGLLFIFIRNLWGFWKKNWMWDMISSHPWCIRDFFKLLKYW